MATRFLKVDLSTAARDFEQVALEPGIPLLDHTGAHHRTLKKWLARLIAEPQWSGAEVSFFVCDEEGNHPHDIRCEPATPADLSGPLASELTELKDRFQQATPASSTERKLHEFASRALLGARPPEDVAGLGCQFFKYRDFQGRWRLVLCYGFRPASKQDDARGYICPSADCRLLQMRSALSAPKCSACGKSFAATATSKRKWKLAALVILLLGLFAAGAGGGFVLLKPSATLVGRVVRHGDLQPIADAVVHVEGMPAQTQTDASGVFRIVGLRRGTGRVHAAAPGFESSQAEVELAGGQESTVELVLPGGSQLGGHVVYRTGDKEIPIAEAIVVAIGVDGPPVATDAQGRFQLTGLAPGTVRISVEAEGFQSHQGEGLATTGNGQPLAVHLVGAARISGRIVYAADMKTPIADAEIGLDGFPGAKVRTDSDGQFEIVGIPPGEMRMQVAAAGFRPAVQTVNAGNTSLTIPLTGDAILTGEVLRADTRQAVADAQVQLPGTPFAARTNAQGAFRLERIRSGKVNINATGAGLAGSLTQNLAAQQTTSVKLLVSGTLTVSGRVVDALNKAPIAGVSIAVADTNLKAKTDSQGRFSLAGLSEATTKLTASVAGYFSEEASIQLSSGRAALDDIALKPAASLKGRVVSGKDGQPLAQTEVAFGEGGPKALTDAQGKFTLEPLPIGVGQVKVSAAEHYPAKLSPQLELGSQSVNDVTLVPLARFRGVVLRALDSTPLEGAVVEIAPTGEKATTNRDGAYEVAQAPAGDVMISIGAEGYEPQRWKQTLEGGTQKLKDILLEGNTLTKGVTLETLDKERAVPGAKLEVVLGKYRKELTSAESGAFELGKLPPGIVEVTARAAGFLDAKVTKRVTPDDAWIRIPMVRLIDAVGVLTDANDKKKPVGKAEIEVISAAGARKTVSDAAGRFKLSGLPPGPVEVQIKAAGYVDARMQMTLDPKVPRLEVSLQPLLTVQGRVVDAGNPRQGVAKARIRLQVGEVVQIATSGADGSFKVTLPAGKVEALVEADDYCETALSAVLTAASPRLEIRAPRGRTLRGQVANAVNNQPVAGALVVALGSGGTKLTGTSDSSGAFEIKSVPVSATVVDVSAGGFESLKVTAAAGSTSPLRVVLSPDLAPGEVRLVLTWAERPRDIDGHLYGPLAGGGRFHISFKDRAAPGATLDVDAKEGLGPETITMKASPGKYQYFVAHSENLGTPDGQGLARSGVQVRVYYKGAKANQPYVLPAVRADAMKPLWHVLDINVDALGKITVEPKHQFYPDLPAK